MKTKNKTFVLVGMAVVLCSVLLVALPAIAADQTTQEVSTTASEDDYVLGIYGNANEDDTIDMRDVTYTKLVIFGKKPETELADAYFDDEVDVLDVVQIKLIILGRESELTFVDANGDDVTVSMPLDKIVVLNTDVAEVIRALGAKDRIVGVTEGMTDDFVFFPDLCEKPSVGKWYSPDIEAILALGPDSIFAFGKWPSPEKLEDKIEGTDITVIRLDFYRLETLRNEMNMLGYLLVEEEKARKYLEWYDEYVEDIDEKVSELSEDEKPRVFIDCGNWTKNLR
jgi:iron complex transport system substrate-binding protein